MIVAMFTPFLPGRVTNGQREVRCSYASDGQPSCDLASVFGKRIVWAAVQPALFLFG
jgi:hypothetical protein